MIVRIQGAAGDRSAHGYLAMRRGQDGDWVPITGRLSESLEAAFGLCVAALRADIAALEEECAGRLAAIETNLTRLRARPTPSDRVRLLGQLCEVDKDGAVTMPELPGLDSQPKVEIEIAHSVLEALRGATRDPELTRERAHGMLVDHAQNQPLDLLLALADAAPDMVGKVAELLVEAGGQLGLESGWEVSNNGD